ncbi:hypothetical protein KL86PLE_100567 [uncultured Pleomorphomonas sp.]|uniref:Transposase n=1 Tax=uncultured Pleomorphomonas sp. TaxID=442121 RepID=A0A212L4C4_9HYPH|nr:hypothetical protein KL86PLE_100567 [uncultured Pleomorphomonas sp.]
MHAEAFRSHPALNGSVDTDLLRCRGLSRLFADLHVLRRSLPALRGGLQNRRRRNQAVLAVTGIHPSDTLFIGAPRRLGVRNE